MLEERMQLKLTYKQNDDFFFLFLLVVFLQSLQAASLQINYRNTQVSSSA